MSSAADRILQGLRAVAAERALRASDAPLDAAVRAIKLYQHARFGMTYADLMAQPRYARAAEFFLTDLYGPADFTDRDAQFARIVPALVRLFPEHIVHTVSELAELHALSERLDTAMARAWRDVGEPLSRERQIGLMVLVGQALDRYTRNAWLRQTLRLMRGPASAAGLAALQGFLERGFDTFRDMAGAEFFLDTIASRERALAARLFGGDPAPDLG